MRRACGIGHLHEPTTVSHDRKGQLKLGTRELKTSQHGGRSSETLPLSFPSLPSPLSPTSGEGEEKERSFLHHLPTAAGCQPEAGPSWPRGEALNANQAGSCDQ